jgi:hypothetical protein
MKTIIIYNLLQNVLQIINISLYSCIYDKNFNEIYNDEIQFGLIQTSKILNNFGFKSVNDFLNINMKDTRKIKQSTSVFEYYILTPILLIKINDFLKIIKNKGTINDVVTLIMNTFNDTSYQHKINSIISNINNIDSIILKTCKMTVININLNNLSNYKKYKNRYLNCKKKSI